MHNTRSSELQNNKNHRDVLMKHIKTAGLMIACTLVVLYIVVQPTMASPGTRWDSLWGFMTENYDDVEGGYHLVGLKASNVRATYPAALILDDMGLLDDRPPIIDLVKMKNFTYKIQWNTGGEESSRYGGFASYIAGPTTMDTTFYGMHLWELLKPHTDIPNINKVKDVNVTAMLFWVNRSQTVSGGFAIDQDRSPDMISTYQALYLITNYASETNWTVDDILLNRTTTIQWILDCRDGGGFKLNPASALPSVSATAAALMALDSLGALTEISDDLQTIRDWILDRQTNISIPSHYYGGYEEGELTNDTNIVSTYYALLALELLGSTPRNIDAVVDFILNCQTANDGGFAIVPNTDVGNMMYSAMAIHSLKLLGSEYLARIYEADPNNPEPPLIDWRTLFVVSIIVMAAVVAIAALRRD